MSAMAERDVVEGSVDELVLQLFSLTLTHLRKAEGVERARVRIVRLIEV